MISFSYDDLIYVLNNILLFVTGKDNLIADGILSENEGFRDLYDETKLPQIALEYPVVLRWMHSLQDGDLR